MRVTSDQSIKKPACYWLVCRSLTTRMTPKVPLTSRSNRTLSTSERTTPTSLTVLALTMRWNGGLGQFAYSPNSVLPKTLAARAFRMSVSKPYAGWISIVLRTS